MLFDLFLILGAMVVFALGLIYLHAVCDGYEADQVAAIRLAEKRERH